MTTWINNIAGGDEQLHDWIFAWAAEMFQQPGGERPGTSLVLRGPPRRRQDHLGKTLGHLLGRHYFYADQPGLITGRFNKHQADKILLFADEGFLAGDAHELGRLKSMVTSSTTRSRPKASTWCRCRTASGC